MVETLRAHFVALKQISLIEERLGLKRMGCDTVIDGVVVENDWRFFLSCVFDLLIICGPNGELLNKAYLSHPNN